MLSHTVIPDLDASMTETFEQSIHAALKKRAARPAPKPKAVKSEVEKAAPVDAAQLPIEKFLVDKADAAGQDGDVVMMVGKNGEILDNEPIAID